MENDKDWVEDVRRWYFNSSRPTPTVVAAPPRRPSEGEAAALGYEAAHPGLQATWQTPPTSRFGSLR